MIDTHYERQYCANGLAYHCTGSSPKVVLLHGVGLSIDSWLEQIPVLSERYPIIMFDLPGHGHCHMPDIKHLKSVSQIAEVITDALASLEIAPNVIIGHSLGALTALDMVHKKSSQFKKVIAISGIFERSMQARKAVQQRANELSDCAQKPDANPTLARWFGDNRYGKQAEWADFSKQMLNNCPLSGYAMAYQAFAESDGPSPEQIKDLSIPSLFITGELDPNSTAQMSRKMSSIASNGQHCIVGGAKHMLQLTHGRVVNRALIDFIGCD